MKRADKDWIVSELKAIVDHSYFPEYHPLSTIRRIAHNVIDRINECGTTPPPGKKKRKKTNPSR